MKLGLRYEPLPDNAHLFAADIVAAAAEISGARLDYTPNSLDAVDGILGEMHRDAVRPEQVAETLFGFGCYVGEVMVRQAGGRWRTPTAETDGLLTGFPFLVELSGGTCVSPIDKVFKRVVNGDEDNIRFYYHALVTGTPG
ncbi:hypothetical protein [Plantactinospora sp. GCM10030261]|uniref:hypothetical protein n=1 Tax=Plantactinospora sp. GCM10030261 TaxID=3273420 RepID=UPI00361A8D4D